MGLVNWLIKKSSNYFTKEIGICQRRSHLSDFDRVCHEILPGDVLLVEGTTRISEIIKRITNSPWTHAALYIGLLHSVENPEMRQLIRKYYHGPPGKPLIIESMLGQGTTIIPIDHYENHHVRICRPNGLSHSDAQHVIGCALSHVGGKYHLRHFFDLGRFAIKSRFFPRRWHSSLFRENIPSKVTEDICSAMIASAFTSVNFPILPVVREKDDHKIEVIHRNPKLFTPSDFDYSPYFSIIKYPIFPLSAHGIYHTLPWNDELISNDEGNITTRHKKPNNPHL